MAEYWQNYKAALDKYPALKTLEEKTQVPKEYAVIGMGALFICFVVFGVGMGFVCNLVGFIPPLYYSILAIESERSDDDELWLTYWCVYAVFSLFEVFIQTLLYWIPFYYAFKVAFLLWCMHPSWRGAEFIYVHFLKDVFVRIDGAKPKSTATAEPPAKAD